MSGHSKWAQIKHKKAGIDAKRGALFSKLGRQISLAAREGGENPDLNPRLRRLIEKARADGVPKDNIERAISRAANASTSSNLQEVSYEAYGPSGEAFLIHGITDNANRTTGEIKNILTGFDGKLAEAGSVGWMFERKGVLEFSPARGQEEKTELLLIDIGAEDVKTKNGRVLALVSPGKMEALSAELKKRGLTALDASIATLPKNTVPLGSKELEKALNIKTALEDLPDVTAVYTNAHL